jgi:hypothetical protein
VPTKKGDDNMDIPAVSMMASQNQLQNQAGIMMMGKAMDTNAQNGQAMLDLLATAGPRLSPAHLGQTLDISA